MVTLRLARDGGKKRPFYHLVATDSRKRRDSGYLERLGFFNPGARGKEERLRIDQERVQYWLSQGAQQSARAAQLIRRHARGEPFPAAPERPPAPKQQVKQPQAAASAESAPAEPEPAAAPEAPAESAAPAEPEAPSEPEAQAGPEAPAEPAESTEPEASAESEASAEAKPPPPAD